MVSEKVVKDPTIRALLNRREEILNEINKLQIEYSAIGNILHENYHYREQIKYKDKEINELKEELEQYEQVR